MRRVGVSSCLLGESVRYDGGHKHTPYITDILGRMFELVPVCPEHEAGLPVPREAMRLQGNGSATPRLVTVSTGHDLTRQMETFCCRKLDQLATLDLVGFILKRRSPSCGIGSASLFDQNGELCSATCNGLFVAALMNRFPELPLIDEEQLAMPGRAAAFVEQLNKRP